jgi:hypothetical protein
VATLFLGLRSSGLPGISASAMESSTSLRRATTVLKSLNNPQTLKRKSYCAMTKVQMVSGLIYKSSWGNGSDRWLKELEERSTRAVLLGWRLLCSRIIGRSARCEKRDCPICAALTVWSADFWRPLWRHALRPSRPTRPTDRRKNAVNSATRSARR